MLIVEHLKVAVASVVLAVVVVLAAAVKIQTDRLEASQRRYDAYVADVEAVGRAAEQRVREINEKNRKDKEKADAEADRLRAERDVAQRRLRDEVARRSFVPRAGDGGAEPTRSAERACYDGAQLDAALQRFAADVAGLVGEGQGAVDALDVVKRWAQR